MTSTTGAAVGGVLGGLILITILVGLYKYKSNPYYRRMGPNALNHMQIINTSKKQWLV